MVFYVCLTYERAGENGFPYFPPSHPLETPATQAKKSWKPSNKQANKQTNKETRKQKLKTKWSGGINVKNKLFEFSCFVVDAR